MMDLVLGLDVGGTSSRALVTTLDGARVGHGYAGAGNPVAVESALAQANVAEALTSALSNVVLQSIRAVVVGAAGAAGSDIFHKVVAALGIACPLRVVGDVVVAFAAGTLEPRGTVLIAGTGAVAAEIDGFDEVRVADGLGWLLGDLGSAFWLGREAAAATARELAREAAAATARELARDQRLVDPDPVSRNFDLPSADWLAPDHAGSLVDLVCEAVGERDSDAFVIAGRAQPYRPCRKRAHLRAGSGSGGEGSARALAGGAAGDSRAGRGRSGPTGGDHSAQIVVTNSWGMKGLTVRIRGMP